jgi:hypothetical protein
LVLLELMVSKDTLGLSTGISMPMSSTEGLHAKKLA